MNVFNGTDKEMKAEEENWITRVGNVCSKKDEERIKFCLRENVMNTIKSCKADANVHTRLKSFQLLAQGIHTLVDDFFANHIINFLWINPELHDLEQRVETHLANHEKETKEEKMIIYKEKWNWNAWVNLLIDKNLKKEWQGINDYLKGKNPFYNFLRFKMLQERQGLNGQPTHNIEEILGRGLYQKRYYTGHMEQIKRYYNPEHWNIDKSEEY